MKIAFLADIHGNLPALEAVMDDLRREAPDHIYLVGDLVNRCLWSNEVLEIMRAQGWPSVQGNHDLIIGTLDKENPAAPFDNRERFPDIWWTLKHIREEHRAYLRSLSPSITVSLPNGSETLPEILIVHGVPGDPFVGFEPGATASNRAKAAGVTQSILVAGHTHLPMHERLDGLDILNPGGVGISHSGDPRAHYMLLHARNNRWEPEFRTVAYAHSAVSQAFYQSGFMDFAGPMGKLHLRTVMTGHAWASDFNFWMRNQSSDLHADIDRAVKTYFATFPDEKQWAFPVQNSQPTESTQ